MEASDGDGSVFSVVCTSSWPIEAAFKVGIILASGSREGSSPCMADGSQVIGRESTAAVWSNMKTS